MSPRVSVIIPIYNVEKYLVRCVESVLGQTLQDIEVILVDDGSPDGSPKMCDEYEAKDSRIKVIHKENGGLASARNAGMDVAEGEYIFFIDSDDWIDANTLEELVDIAVKYQVDFVRFRPMYAGWPGREDGSLCDFGTEKGMKEGVYTKEGIIREIYPRLFATPELTLGVIVAAWRSLYLRSFMEKNCLRFDEEVRYSEDTIFSAKVVRAANSFFYLDGARYYHYFYNSQSITKSFKKDRWESCKQLIYCFERDFLDSDDYDFSEQLKLQKLYCIVSALSQKNLLVNLTEREEYCRKICEDRITEGACKNLDKVHVSWKLKLYLILVKYKQIKILARI